MVFRGLAFLGPDSDRALRAAVAAGRQNRLWNVAEALYHRQGGENTGWVTDGLLKELAGARALSETSHPWVERQIASADRAAQAAGIPGTPSFQVGRTGGRVELVRLSSIGPEGLTPAIEAALRS
jgi:protein-disulfide isomerase